MNFVGASIAATIRIKQIAAVMTTETMAFSATCWILIARGMISSTATIGCGNNVNWITLVPIKFGH
jgi:hypothetical protein